MFLKRISFKALFCVYFLAVALPGVCQENAAVSESENAPVPRWFPDASSGIHPVGYLYLQTDKAAQWAATHYDMIARWTISSDGARERIKRYNPNIILFAYIDATHAPFDKAGIQDETEFLINIEVISAHPEWVLKKEDGTPILIKPYKTKRLLMDPGHSGWREYIAKQAIYATDGQPNGYPQMQDIKTSYDGLHLDEPFPSCRIWPLSMTERPINPRTGKLYTEDEWHNDMKGLVKYVNDALKRRWPKNERKGYLIINGIDPFSDDEFLQKQWRDLLQFADGTALEGFIHAPWQKPDQWYTWERCIGDLEYAESQGKVVIALSNSDGGDPAFHSRLHMYALASYLIAKGKRSYFTFPPYVSNLDFAGVLNDETGSPYWWKGWSVDIGTPTATRTKDALGVWRRPYSNGLVLVNPTDKTAIVKLEKDFYLLKEDGDIADKPIREITLPSRTGAILLVKRR